MSAASFAAGNGETLSMTRPNYLIRQADETEAGLVSYLRLASLLSLEMAGYSLVTIREFMTALPDVDSRLLATGSYYLADDGGDLIGGAGWSVLPLMFLGPNLIGEDGRRLELTLREDSVLVRGFFLDPDMGRHGAGSALLSHIEEDAMRAGYSGAEIVVPAFSQLRYRGLGFKPANKLAMKLDGGAMLPLLQMRKRLGIRCALAA
jgi:GNAT superfamily N-acetyltransferase